MAQNYAELVKGVARLQAMLQAAARSVDQLLSVRNWFIGAFIVEYEQNGEDQAAYGEQLLERLGADLTAAGCKGLSNRNLKNCRQVALAFPALDIRQTASAVFPLALTAEIRRAPSASCRRLPMPPCALCALDALARPLPEGYTEVMMLRALVKDGRLILDEPTSLPEGTVLDLVVVDEGDNLDDEERAALHDDLAAAWESVRQGRVRPASDILNELRSR